METPLSPLEFARRARKLYADREGVVARDHLAHFKVPQGFTVLAELPKTATGKIQKYVLRGGRPNLAPQ